MRRGYTRSLAFPPPASFLLGLLLFSNTAPAFATTLASPEREQAIVEANAESRGLLTPFPDGNLHPEAPLTRLDLIRGLVHDVYSNDLKTPCFNYISATMSANYTLLFTDIPRTHASAEEVCIGMFTGLIKGHEDGSFGPRQGANVAEAAKMISKAYGIAPFQGLVQKPSVPWHESYWYALAKRNALPQEVRNNRGAILTRGEFAMIMSRLEPYRPPYGYLYESNLPTDAVSVARDIPLVSDVPDTLPDAPGLGLPTAGKIQNNVVSSAALLIQIHAEERRQQRITEAQGLYLVMHQ